MKDVLVIGGGIVGLSSALYLQKSGYRVTVADKGDFLNNCSYGNAGYVCPSHFIPLATPGIVLQGFKWMFNDRSPFYVQPRLDRALLDWGWKFIRSATKAKVEKAAIPLRDLSLISKEAYESWLQDPGLEFSYEKKGLLEIFLTPEKEAHAHHSLEKAQELGLAARMLSSHELEQLEPQTRITARGALLFECDAHLYPNKLMSALRTYLQKAGVRMLANREVYSFEKSGTQVRKVIFSGSAMDVDQVVIATGSWSRSLVRQLGLRLPLVPGRGYSITLEDPRYRLQYPSVLMEGRVALTPMDGNKTRIGGTMEITSTQTPPRYRRVEGILQAVRRYYPDFDIPTPEASQIWYGYRPCSADGLPYIGRLPQWENVTVATGHAMVGLSLGAGTGKIVSELVDGRAPTMDLHPFRVDRFQ